MCQFGLPGLSTSPDSLLRLIRAQPEEQVPTPQVLGVDDFSFRKRKTYGTILLDLERRIPIDILPDREATTLEKWLKEHESVEILSRDRGGPYAEVQMEGESCRFQNKYLPLFGPYCEKNGPLDHLT